MLQRTRIGSVAAIALVLGLRRRASRAGKKLVCVPEIWRWCSDDAIPQELALITQAGRELDIATVFDTQRPENVNPSITGAATELVCFKLLSPEALREVGKLGADRERVAALPLGILSATTG